LRYKEFNIFCYCFAMVLPGAIYSYWMAGIQYNKDPLS
jgi:hypothetical protein